MRDILIEIVKQTMGLFETIKVTGTDAETRLQSVDKEKCLFLEAVLNEPVEDMQGVFGMTNLGLLRGLLDFTSYKAEGSTFATKRRDWKDGTTVEQFEFRDPSGRGASTYRCMSPERIPEQAEIRNINYEIVVDPNKSKMAEFEQLAKLYSEVDKLFGVRTEGGSLLFCFGDENSSAHRGTMVYASDVGDFKGEILWPTGQFLSVLRLAGDRPTKLKFSSRGVLAIEVETQIGKFNYYLRASQR